MGGLGSPGMPLGGGVGKIASSFELIELFEFECGGFGGVNRHKLMILPDLCLGRVCCLGMLTVELIPRSLECGECRGSVVGSF